MSDSEGSRGAPFERPPWVGGPAARPSLGQIGLQQFAPYLINSVSLSWTTHLAATVKAHGLTTTKMRALAILSIASPVTINELSLYALTEQSTMSRTLDSLVEQGLIDRRPQKGDARVREVELTNRGREIFAAYWPALYIGFTKLFSGVTEEEFNIFVQVLHKLVRNQERR